MYLPNMWSYGFGCVASLNTVGWSPASHFSHYHIVSFLCPWLVHTTQIFVTYSALLWNSAVTVLSKRPWGSDQSPQLSMTPKLFTTCIEYTILSYHGKKSEFGVSCSAVYKIFLTVTQCTNCAGKVPNVYTAATKILSDHCKVRGKCGVTCNVGDTTFSLR